jgi:hypothetical protein
MVHHSQPPPSGLLEGREGLLVFMIDTYDCIRRTLFLEHDIQTDWKDRARETLQITSHSGVARRLGEE